MKLNRVGRFNIAKLSLALPLAAAVLALGTGCSTVPVTGRSQLNLMSPSQEAQLGLTSFETMKKELPISQDVYAKALVQKVGQKVAAVVGSDMPDAQWEFVVFESGEANAFCLPGGKVGVYTGILPITKDEAGLATVIGHEIAHAVARHGGERISQAMVIEGLGSAVNAAMANTDPRYQSATMLAYGVGTKLGAELPFSRQQESEADHIGLLYMAQAGYDPEQAVKFWERFAEFNQKQGGETVWFLSTHPLNEDRIKHLKEWMPEAKRKAAEAGVK
jgi:predicted Zn-dependent protease